MLDNLDEHINKQQQQTADEPPAKRIKREEENEVCRSACVWGVEREAGEGGGGRRKEEEGAKVRKIGEGEGEI